MRTPIAVIAPPPRARASPQRDPFRFGLAAWLVNFGVWTLLATLTVASWLIRPGASVMPNQVVPLIGQAYFWTTCCAMLTPAVFWMTSRFSMDAERRGVHTLLIVGVLLPLAFLVSLVVSWYYVRFVPGPTWGSMTFAERVWSVARGRYPIELLAMAAIATAGVARDYYRRYRARREEAARLEVAAAQLRAKSAQLQAELSEARLTVLRAQLDPHFLFNTLNAASALIDKDPSGAQRMISLLGELLRHSLKGSSEHEVPLGEELELLRQYLQIMEIRYHGRLHTSITIDPDVTDALVPSLVLQPFAENAMKHGVSKANGRGRVDVHARRSGNRLILTVQDTGPGKSRPTRTGPETESSGKGIGLRNTRARFDELYGDDYRLELRPTPAGGMLAELALPFRTRAEGPVNGGRSRTVADIHV